MEHKLIGDVLRRFGIPRPHRIIRVTNDAVLIRHDHFFKIHDRHNAETITLPPDAMIDGTMILGGQAIVVFDSTYFDHSQGPLGQKLFVYRLFLRPEANLVRFIRWLERTLTPNCYVARRRLKQRTVPSQPRHQTALAQVQATTSTNEALVN